MKIFTWKQRVIVFFTTIAVISVFALIGYAIGTWVDNVALLVMLGVLVSYPFSLFAIAKVLRRNHEKSEKKAGEAGSGSVGKEEKKEEKEQ